MSTDKEVVPILVTLGHLGDDSLQLRFPSEHSDEIPESVKAGETDSVRRSV